MTDGDQIVEENSCNEHYTKKMKEFNKYEDLDWKHKNRLDMILLYKPGRTLSSYLEAKVMNLCSKHNIQNINIGLFGFIGSGKSTLINRLTWFFDKRAWSEEIVSVRQIDLPDYRLQSLTTERNRINVKSGINVIDNRGIIELNPNVISEIGRQCEGKIKPDTIVDCNWEPKIKNSIIRKFLFQDCSRFDNAIHCPIITYRLDDERQPEIFQQLIEIIYSSTNVFPIIVVTLKIEKYDIKKINYRKDISLIELLQCDILNRKVAQFHQLHCGRVCVIPINNIPSDIIDLIETSALIDLLFNCCCVADLKLKKLVIDKEGVGGCC